MLSLKRRRELARKAVESGNWIIRYSSDGKSYGGFQWTEAPDWNERPVCGGGLHGCGPTSGGDFIPDGVTRLEFCETSGPHVVVEGNKEKVKRARILLVDEIPANLTEFKGRLIAFKKLTAPALAKAGWVWVREGATFTAPALTKAGWVDVSQGATLIAPKLKR